MKPQIEFLKDLKESADKGMWWRDPNLYPEEYRKLYEKMVSENLEMCISVLEELDKAALTSPNQDY